MTAPKGKALIGQSGGPTAVINQSLVGLIEACIESPHIDAVYGAKSGIGGVLAEEFIDLTQQDAQTLEAVAQTPCAGLRSIRKKPTKEECVRALEVMKAHGIRYFFYIGGNDSAETAHILNQVAMEDDYELRLFHVPKTIDNDLRMTDHCPGYGSAARFVSMALMGDNEDSRSLPGVKIDVIMGRNAGWLTAAGALARHHEEDGPHLIYLPERNFEWDRFLGDIDGVVSKYGRCLVAASEGIHDASGTLIAEEASLETDAFGNKQLSGSGALGDILATRVRNGLKGPGGKPLRVRADTFGYLQRSFFGFTSEVDSREAREVGRRAVEAATNGSAAHGTIVIQRNSNDPYEASYEVAALKDVARDTKEMPDEFIDGENAVSAAFLDYARPLVGPLPRPG
ncbi:MAG: 6-phosphofructokinase, partial [Planctomycetota bacterium]